MIQRFICVFKEREQGTMINPKRFYKVTAFFTLAVMMFFAFYANERVLEVGSSHIMKADDVPESDAILVLGAYVSPDGLVSRVLEERLKVGYELYKQGKANRIIVSGDHSRKDYDEVNAMKKYYLDRQIPGEQIFMDHAGFTTYESMYRAKDIFGVEKVIVVTQKFHLPRAVFIARELGMEAYGVEAETGLYNQFVILKNNVRESFARCKAFVVVAIKPKPTFLGDVIPVTGSGKATDDKLYNHF